MGIKFRTLAAMAMVVAGATACADNLGIKNYNQPSLALVYGTASGIDGVMSSLFRTFHNNTQSGEGLNSQSKAFALESYGQVANFGMALRGGIPRIFINNQRGNQVATGNSNHYNLFSRLMRTAATATQSLDAFTGSGKTLGSPADDARARAWGFFINGIAMGALALGYDSMAVATPQTPGSAIPVLVGYNDAMTTAVQMLDSAEALAGAGISSIPATWVGSTVAWTQADFIRVIRTYRARYRTNVFRTPAEAAAAGAPYWTLVRDDALNGITADMVINLNGATNWNSALDAGTFMTSPSWHQVSLMYAGVADTSGQYQAIFGQASLSARNGMALLVQTPDNRWPTGDNRALQSADTLSNGSPLNANQYLINRNSSGDQPDAANPWGTSMYDHRRWLQVAKASGVGTYVYMARSETRLIEAEARLMLGDVTGAATLVNVSRTAHNLPTFAATTLTDLAPGGTGCVPRLRDNTCGNIWDALAYEKRMETQLTGYMQWFNDSRRWGDLPAATALHWPVPNEEMDARNLPFYNMPATGTMAGAAGSAKYGV
jgi:hypothetical protein